MQAQIEDYEREPTIQPADYPTELIAKLNRKQKFWNTLFDERIIVALSCDSTIYPDYPDPSSVTETTD